MSPQNRSFGACVNDWLQEAPGELFTHNKWRFWFITVIGFALINAGLTAAVFSTGGVLQTGMGAILLGVGGLVAWICVGALHYSDAHDRRLARGVAALDSLTLLFVVAHFAFLTWTYGHLVTLQNAEAKYELAAARYNAEARAVSTDNVAIAQAAQAIAQENTKPEHLRNDTMYQARKAAEAGARLPGQRRQTPAAGPALTTSAVELEKPEKPPESSAAFLTRWDSLIRLANFGELLLAVLTLIYIRTQSAKTNSSRVIYDNVDEFPDSLETENRLPTRRAKFTQKKDTAKTHASYDFEGLKRLREALRDISFRLHKRCFKVDIRGDAVWIRLVAANNFTQETIASAKAKLDILNDAMAMPREAFRERLENFLRQNGFEI